MKILRAALAVAVTVGAALAADTAPERLPAFPLKLLDDGQRPCLVDQNEIPFLLTCEIAQAMLNRLKIEDVRHYLEVRKSHGYNAIWLIIASPNAMIDDTVFARPAPGPQNAYGVPPFDNAKQDLTSPNREYFNYVRAIVDEAARRGMLVGIAPAYVGANGRDLLPIMKNAGPEGCRAFGEFIGEFFRDQPNIFWIHHGDQNPYNFGGAASAALVDAFVSGLQRTDDRYPRFHTAITRITPSTGVSPSKSRTSSYQAQFDATGQRVNPMPWLNLNHVYVKNRGQYGVMLADMLDAWKTYRSETNPRLPYVVLDGVCEHYNDDARANRAQGYYALLSGAVGFFTGNIRTCWFMSPDSPPAATRNWKDEILGEGAMSATHTAKLFRSLPWWTLVPDTGGKLFESSDKICAAARSSDDRLAVLYMPTRRPVVANLAEMKGGSITANWFDPRNGVTVAAGTFERSARTFVPPAGSRDEEEDWVLVLQSQKTEAATGEPRPAVFAHSVIDAAGPASIWGKCAADLNGDGRVDLLAAGWRGGGLVWYENPRWTRHVVDATGKFGTDLEVADVDRDGKPDIVAIVGDGISWYRGPDWKPHVVAQDAVHDLEVGDFDGDGDLDLVARNQNLSRGKSGATLFVYRQETPDTWTRFTQAIPDGEGLQAADLDRDGDLDLVLNGTWLENRRDLSAPWIARVFGPEWKQDKVFVATGDLNGDGRIDIALAPSEPKGQRHRISWFEAPADLKSGAWREHIIEADIESVQHFIGIADFNLDGRLDVVTAAMLQGEPPQNVSVYLNDSRGAQWTKHVIGTTGNHSMRIVDLDGSGRPSLFGANHQSNKVELWRNDTPRSP